MSKWGQIPSLTRYSPRRLSIRNGVAVASHHIKPCIKQSFSSRGHNSKHSSLLSGLQFFLTHAVLGGEIYADFPPCFEKVAPELIWRHRLWWALDHSSRS